MSFRCLFPPRRAALLIMTTVLLMAGCSPDDFLPLDRGGPPASEEEQISAADSLIVEQVDVQVLESFPVQVQVVVKGSLPDACTEIGEIGQTRDGNAVTVTIGAVRPADALCAQVLEPFEQVVPLDGPFPPGTYVVRVNGVETSFTV